MHVTISPAQIAEAKAAIDLPRLIGESLPLHRLGRHWLGLCPFHGEKTPSFHVYPDHFHCFGCGKHGDAIAWTMHARNVPFAEAVRVLGGWQATDRPIIAAPRPTPPSRPEKPSPGGLKVWAEAIEAAGSPAEAYLRSRGLHLPPEPVLRFHPACPCAKERRPAMVALMTDPVTGEPRGVHRTFIKPDGSGKADDLPEGASAKMMLGSAGVIRLYELETEGLGIAEGIETALAVAQRLDWRPVWATGSADTMRKFPVLVCCALTIFADTDDKGVGLTAARQCGERWAAAGSEARICIPFDAADWDDVARRLAA